MLPGGHARIFVATWNLAGQRLSQEDLHQWLRPLVAEKPADLYVLGIQEGHAFESGFWQACPHLRLLEC